MNNYWENENCLKNAPQTNHAKNENKKNGFKKWFVMFNFTCFYIIIFNFNSNVIFIHLLWQIDHLRGIILVQTLPKLVRLNYPSFRTTYFANVNMEL